uniref:Uncharacterized protein n=1 Tax=Sphaerodactylus townsendi TaxID=933632 RepID=A0ACB8F0K3_9SAUR
MNCDPLAGRVSPGTVWRKKRVHPPVFCLMRIVGSGLRLLFCMLRFAGIPGCSKSLSFGVGHLLPSAFVIRQLQKVPFKVRDVSVGYLLQLPLSVWSCNGGTSQNSPFWFLQSIFKPEGFFLFFYLPASSLPT